MGCEVRFISWECMWIHVDKEVHQLQSPEIACFFSFAMLFKKKKYL